MWIIDCKSGLGFRVELNIRIKMRLGAWLNCRLGTVVNASQWLVNAGL